MKRSEINAAIRQAEDVFAAAGWALPPEPKWDLTDLGLGRFRENGLVLINLAEEPEYCEKLMYLQKSQVMVLHTHKLKKEDIICRTGRLGFELWAGHPSDTEKGECFHIKRNGREFEVASGVPFAIEAGERITLVPGIYHAFWAESDGCVIGEVSTANDDLNDNFFVDENVGRFPDIEEDEEPLVRLLWERAP